MDDGKDSRTGQSSCSLLLSAQHSYRPASLSRIPRTKMRSDYLKKPNTAVIYLISNERREEKRVSCILQPRGGAEEPQAVTPTEVPSADERREPR